MGGIQANLVVSGFHDFVEWELREGVLMLTNAVYRRTTASSLRCAKYEDYPTLSWLCTEPEKADFARACSNWWAYSTAAQPKRAASYCSSSDVTEPYFGHLCCSMCHDKLLQLRVCRALQRARFGSGTNSRRFASREAIALIWRALKYLPSLPLNFPPIKAEWFILSMEHGGQ